MIECSKRKTKLNCIKTIFLQKFKNLKKLIHLKKKQKIAIT